MPAVVPSRAVAFLSLAVLAGCETAGDALDGLAEASEGLREETAALFPARAPGQTRPVDLGVGIVGTVTESSAGRVMVNGLEVATPPGAMLHGGMRPAGPLGSAPVAPGHVVEIAAETEEGRLIAREIEPIFAVAGPVEAIKPAERRLLIMGADVMVPDEAVLPAGGFGALRPGQRVAVSGLWRGEELVASRIEPASGAEAVASGVVTPLPGGRYRVGGVPVAAEWGDLVPGFPHVVSGRWVADALLVDEVRVGRSVIGRWPVEDIVVEGYGRARDFAGFYSGYPGPRREGYYPGYSFVGENGILGEEPAWRDYFVAIGGLGRPVDVRDSEVSDMADARALFVGEYEGGFDGEFDIEHIIPLPEALGPRREALAAMRDPFLPAAGAVAID